MNNTQRKYLKERIESVFAAKLAKIAQLSDTVPKPYANEKEKLAVVNAILAEVGLPCDDRYGILHYIKTPAELEYAEKVAAVNEKGKSIKTQLLKEKTAAMDAVILGADADALLAAVSKLEAFAIELN